MTKSFGFWFYLVFTLIALVFVILAIAYPFRAALGPLVIGIPTVLMGIVVTLGQKWPGLLKNFDVNIGVGQKQIKLATDKEVEEAEASKISPREETRRWFYLFGWIVGYLLVIFFVGFTIANFVFPAAYLIVHQKVKWWKAAIFGAVIAMAVWYGIQNLMQGELFKGIVPELIPDLIGGETIPPA
jgi:hypothetical protein